MKAIFILADSLNRRFIPSYNGKEQAIVPNMERLRKRSTLFTNHWVGSSPCMPARRDLMTGRYNFLERPWGGIEPYDHTLQQIMTENGIYSRMETDHYCYSVAGGENYWKGFSSWQLHRGQQCDKWQLRPCETGLQPWNKPLPAGKGYRKSIYDDNRATYYLDSDFPTPRTFAAAASWLEENHDADNFFLWAEGFDPHEPFDVPQEYIDLYDDTYTGEELYWPAYEPTDGYSEDEIHHLRTRYKALMTMTDKYIGKILDVVDRHDMWDDTMIIFTTDHGYMLGEHGFWAKNYMPDYNEIMHIPCMIHYPGGKRSTVDALTQNIDMFPTILSWFGIDAEQSGKNEIHGRNLLPILRGEQEEVRSAAIYGMFGKTVNITDGRYTYLRAAKDETNMPLNVYGVTLTMLEQYIGYDSMEEKDFDKIELTHLPWTKFPVLKIPGNTIKWDNDSCYFHYRMKHTPDTLLFDIASDYEQNTPLKDEVQEKRMTDLLIKQMKKFQAPEEQFVRLGLMER